MIVDKNMLLMKRKNSTSLLNNECANSFVCLGILLAFI